MLAFIYDQTFEGLLSAVFDAYARKAFPTALLGGEDARPLFVTATHRVITSPDKAGRVHAGLKKRLSRESLQAVSCAWLAETPDSDLLLFNYMRGVFDSGNERDYADPTVFAVNQLGRKVYGEAHKLQGFCRFQKTSDNIYFSAVSPRYNVLPLLCGHFANRLAGESWVIYDLGRHYGMAHKLGRFREVYLDEGRMDARGNLGPDDLAENEALLQRMWRSYCTAVTIEERKNLKQQARCMPRRFWPYLTELHPA